MSETSQPFKTGDPVEVIVAGFNQDWWALDGTAGIVEKVHYIRPNGVKTADVRLEERSESGKIRRVKRVLPLVCLRRL